MRRPRAAAWLLLACGAALAPAAVEGGRALARRWRAEEALRARAALPPEEPPLSRPALSQVGYSPAMPKRFTAGRPFASFEVRREEDGAEVLRGGAGREVRSEVLGAGGAAWVGDLSALRTPGRYRVRTDGGHESHPFAVGEGLFDPVVRAVQRAFYFQRAFTAVEARHAEGPWVHGSDASRAPPGERMGWHDAGDFSLYVASAWNALFWLLEAHRDFGPGPDDLNLPESGNGVPDLLDEARWGLEWMLSIQEPSGAFRNVTCLDRYGPYGTNLPERGPPYRPGEPGTLATARAAGTLAQAAEAFAPWDPAFAARCLAAARRGWAFLEARPGEDSDGPTCPALRQDGDRAAGRDARAYAAAGLLLATGEPRFAEAFERFHRPPSEDPSYRRGDVQASLLYLRAPGGSPARREAIRAALGALAARARDDGAAHPFGWAGRYFWGSIGAGFQRSAAFSAKACLADPRGAAGDCAQALDDVHYALGRNSLHVVYVSGLPGVEHGRRRAFHHWLAALGAEPFLFPGLVSGGPVAAPDPADRSVPEARPLPMWGYLGDPALPRGPDTPLDARWTDNDSFSTNELDVDWQGVAVYAFSFARWWAAGPGRAGPEGVVDSPAGRPAR